MPTTLDELRGRANQFLSELARLQHEYFLGRSKQLSTKGLYRAFPELSDPETFAQFPTAPFLEFIATHIEEFKAVEVNDAITAFEGSPSLPSIGLEPPLSIREAIAAIPHQSSRARREKLESVLASGLVEHQGLYAERAAAGEQAARALGFVSYLGLRQ